jgi:3-phosphoshikimate 1-carboxyvinyltransferase
VYSRGFITAEIVALSSIEKPSLTIVPVSRPIRGVVRPPGSKSITNRALVCAALARGTSTLTGALDSEDTRVMIDSLRRLGIDVVSRDEGTTLIVHGCGGKIPASSADLFVGNSGTTIRFLTAMCALGHGTYRLDGIDRMRERPIGDLVDALRQMGVDCRYELREGFPPVVVHGTGPHGGGVFVRADISSQFLSAILLTGGATAGDGLSVVVRGKLVSKPYVDMTARVMEAFGCFVNTLGDEFEVPDYVAYRACRYAIEPDASAASYFWAAAAITGGEVTVEGLTKHSLQGDVRFVECLKRMGCGLLYHNAGVTVSGRAARGIDVDLNAISDTVQTLAAVALFAEGPTTIRGVDHIRHKETDRIGDLARELRKFGAVVEELDDGLKIIPPPTLARSASEGNVRPISIETYNDHRMAMSLALTGLVLPGITILNPGCTAKTYPRFFDDLQRLVNGS